MTTSNDVVDGENRVVHHLNQSPWDAVTSGYSKASRYLRSEPPKGILLRAAWLFCLAACACHILSLPLYVTFDSLWYVRLSEILGTKHFAADWDFLRTPLFPAMLKLAFWLWGRQALAVFGLQTGLACAGIWLLSRTLRQLTLPVESAIGIVLLSAFPTLIAFEHILMSEVSSFFCMCLLIYVLAAPGRTSLKGASLLAVTIAVGYYFRSSFIWLSPIFAAIYIVKDFKPRFWQTAATFKRRFTRQALPQFMIVSLLPFVLAYPWQRNPEVSTRDGHVLLYGLVKQAVLPLNDPILGAAARQYAKMIEESKINGSLPLEGLTSGREWSVITPIYSYGSAGHSIFLRAIRADPYRYFQAVLRNLLLFAEFRGARYDSAIYRNNVFYLTASRIDPGPAWIAPLGEPFRHITELSFTMRLLRDLCPLFDALVALGLIATVAGLLFGLWRLDSAILAFTAPVLAFMLLHAVVLTSQERMIVPVQPILLLNLVLLPAWVRAAFRRAN